MIAGVGISIISVVYMSFYCFSLLGLFHSSVMGQYSNVYDMLFGLFRNGNNEIFDLFKMQIDK